MSHCCNGKAINITYYECVGKLCHQAYKAHASYCHVTYPALPHFFTLSHKRHFFPEKRHWTQNVFWFSLQLLSETFLIIRRRERDMIKNLYCSSCTVPLFLSDFNKTSIFSTDLRKICKCKFLWKSIQCEPSCSTRTGGRPDGRTDRLT